MSRQIIRNIGYVLLQMFLGAFIGCMVAIPLWLQLFPDRRQFTSHREEALYSDALSLFWLCATLTGAVLGLLVGLHLLDIYKRDFLGSFANFRKRRDESKAICFEILINGQKKCLAGVGKDGMLHAIINAHFSTEPSLSDQETLIPEGQPFLTLGGGNYDEHRIMNWTDGNVPLTIGDEVTLRVVESESWDEPSVTHWPDDNTNWQEEERKYRYAAYLEYKRQFEADGAVIPEDELDTEYAKEFRRNRYYELRQEFDSENNSRES
jgi:hypothetical protein